VTQKSNSAAVTPFQTTAPPPVLTMAHIGRVSLKVTWLHVYNVSEFIQKYRVSLYPGPTIDLVRPNEGDDKSYTFTGLAMNFTYRIEVKAVNQPPVGPEAVGPPGVVVVNTLPEWAEPPGQGIDGWTGSGYTAGRTGFTYSRSGIYTTVDHWAADAVKNQQALMYPGGATADRIQGMTWIEFNVDVPPELMITAVLMKAGHRWPQ